MRTMPIKATAAALAAIVLTASAFAAQAAPVRARHGTQVGAQGPGTRGHGAVQRSALHRGQAKPGHAKHGWIAGHGSISGEGTGCLPASLRQTLAQVSQRFGSLVVVSAHRAGAKIAGSGRKSYHSDCRAVDFNPPKGRYGEVVDWLESHHNGGIGTYSCGMHHIHIDNGPHVRFHRCQGA